MGVKTAGPTLEIQLIADVARLKRDMADMQSTVKAATASVGTSFVSAGKASAVAATQMAVAAQQSARAAVGAASGYHALGMSAGNARIVSLELFHVSRALTEQLAMGVSPLRALTSEFGRIGTALQYSGGNVGSLIKQLLTMVGVLKVTQNAELAGAAATAEASAASVRAVAERAAATVMARQTQVALAQAALAAAEGADAEALAQGRLVKALRAVEVAAGQATIAQQALATAEAEAGGAAKASAAATTVALGPIAIALAGLAVVGGFAFGALKQFQAQVKDSGELTKYRDSLGLTRKEMEQLSDGVKKVGGHIKTLGDVSLTTGDVMAGLWKTIADSAPTGAGAGTWTNFKKNAVDAFNQILNAWIAASEGITAGIYGTYNAAKVIWHNFPAMMGDFFVQAANLAIQGINSLLQASVSGLNWLIDKVNSVAGRHLIDTIAPPQGIAEIANRWKGAAEKSGAAIVSEFSKSLKETQKADQAFWHQVGENAKQSLKDRMKAEADALKANEAAKKPKKQSDHGLALALAELDARIKGQWALAAAYQVSDVEAIKAEALQKAEEQAIRHKGDAALFYEKELALAIANRAAEGGKLIADIHAEAAAHAVVNDLVEQGIVPVERMSQALEEQTKKRSLMAALAVAEDQGWVEKAAELRAEISNLAFAQGVLNDDLARTAALQQIAANDNATAKLQKEIDLIGASNRVRAVGLAILEAQQKIAHEGTPLEKQQALIDSYVKQANATADLAEKQTLYNNSLSYMADLLGLIDQQAQQTASSLSNAFGSVGAGIGQALTALTTYAAAQAKIDQNHAAAIKAGISDEKERTLYATASANAQLQSISGVVGGLKSMFKVHSAGYKAMEAVEKVQAALQLANIIKAIALDGAYTASSVAKSGVRAIANGVEAFAKTLASLPFPFNIAAGAAVLAALAAVGINIAGGGSSSATPPTSPEDLQKAAGAGTVLGDSAAKSASIADSLALMAKNSTKGLDYSSAMVSELRKIQSGIGSLTAAIATVLKAQGGFFDPKALGLGTKTSGIQGLFGSKTTTSLYDQGITLNAATVGQIMEQGISGATYNVIEKVKKNSGFLGIGGSTKTSYSTTTGALGSDITSQFDAIIGQVYTSVVDAAKVLGLDVGAALKTFQVSIGQISFKDLTGQQITDQLNAIFSKIGDQMAGFAVAGLAGFQKVGEGLYETLMRLAKDFLTVRAALDSIGMVAPASIAARESLIDLAGGLDAFVSQINFFYDHFLSDAQKTAFMQQQVDAAFGALGVSVPASISDFANLVTGLDLTSAAGQSMFQALMQVAPAFYDVATAAEALAKKQQDLQVQLLQAQGNTAAATELQRQAALAALDPTLRGLQQTIYDTLDAASAAAAAVAFKNKQDALQVQLLQAQGKATQALALQRQLELAALDPALRAMQQAIYNAQDAAAAAAAAEQAKAQREQILTTARDNLTQAYQRESAALQQTIDKFSGFAATLRDFRDSLFTTAGSGTLGTNAALVQLMKQAGLAGAGDEAALGGALQGAAQQYLDVATANARSLQDVQRARALVARSLDQGIAGATSHASIAEQQLDNMKNQVGRLVDINTSVLSVQDAIKALTALMFPGASPTGAHVPPPLVNHPAVGGTGTRSAPDTGLHDKIDRLHTATELGAHAAQRTARLLERVTKNGDSLTVSTDSDTPVQTQSV